MLFHSYAFVLVFLPGVLVGVAALRRWDRHAATLGYISAASLLFYAWWNWHDAYVLGTSIAGNYGCARLIAADRDELYTMPVFSHFRPAVGHTILRHLLGHACDGCGEVARAILASGVLVDANNIDARLRQQDLALPPLLRPVGLLDEKKIRNRKRQTGNSTLASPPCPTQVPVSISCFPFPVCHPPREAT